MSKYLTEAEIPRYCTSQAGVELSDVIIASNLIDGYLGKSFSVKCTVETVKVNERLRGKLKNNPVVEIEEVFELERTPISINKKSVLPENIYLDEEADGYFTYTSTRSPFLSTFNIPFECMTHEHGRTLVIKYKFGYEDIPEEIKIVTGMLAQNIRQLGSFAGMKKINTLDYTIEMANPSFFTNDMRAILSKFRGY